MIEDVAAAVSTALMLGSTGNIEPRGYCGDTVEVVHKAESGETERYLLRIEPAPRTRQAA